MKFAWSRFNNWFDPRSLQVQLGVTLAALITMGLSGVALWTTWRVQQILIESHKETIVGIGDRIGQDVTLYTEMMTIDESVQKALNNRASSKLLLWVQKDDGSLFAAAPHAYDAAWKQLNSPRTMAAIFDGALPPRIFRVGDKDYVACESPIVVSSSFQGELFIAQDITQDQQKFEAVVRAQVVTTISAIVLMTLVMVFYLNRALRPLQNICHVTQNISAEDLESSQLAISQAPTEIQQLADRFNMMLARLSTSWKKEQDASTRQRQFVSNVSHELRTPLTVVQGYLQSLLRRGSNLNEVQRDALNIASEEAEHTVQVLQDLLDLARADDGYIPYRMEHVILNDLIKKVAEGVQQTRKRPIQVDCPEDLITAYTDESRLQQVLVNLVDNAVKYSEPGTPVKITAESTEQYATIEVCDRGPGIPQELHDRIFERFYRVDEARTRSGGTGLGLSIVKTFVEGMKGQVSLNSAEKEGSTFTLRLPTIPASS
ncbi:MAG: ATP-binding protein [Cyanobacteria bacterium P01_F01_bin.42]